MGIEKEFTEVWSVKCLRCRGSNHTIVRSLRYFTWQPDSSSYITLPSLHQCPKSPPAHYYPPPAFTSKVTLYSGVLIPPFTVVFSIPFHIPWPFPTLFTDVFSAPLCIKHPIYSSVLSPPSHNPVSTLPHPSQQCPSTLHSPNLSTIVDRYTRHGVGVTAALDTCW